ncbi:putative Lysine-specific metallo-endopeptidase domain-containing protein [Seiridium unicorne]|uniref:Lysine-specific metallo-endopeptidase domain-containing protein n=1 Tax=Seiridium unicorne TaxID=138068 RepID=A0ABR2V258_9PEZI
MNLLANAFWCFACLASRRWAIERSPGCQALAAQEDKPDFAVSPIDADNDRKDIFNKYFNEDNRLLVRQVFKKIMGDPENPRDLDATGSNALGDIGIKEDSQTATTYIATVIM